MLGQTIAAKFLVHSLANLYSVIVVYLVSNSCYAYKNVCIEFARIEHSILSVSKTPQDMNHFPVH